MKKPDWLTLLAIIFLLWGIINSFLDISRYGIEKGEFLWFCNISMFVIAYGIIRKDSRWIIGFLPFAFLTQTFWIFENFFRLSTKENLFGLIEFMYQPGFPLDEFIISHYHLFAIPLAVVSLFFLKTRKGGTTKIIFTCGMVIFFLSYIFSYPDKNINCIKEPCFASLEKYGGFVYSFIFPLVLLSISSVLAYYLQALHNRMRFGKKKKFFAVFIFSMVVAFAATFTILDVRYKNDLPRFACLGPYESGGIKISCKYTDSFKNGQMWFVYMVESKSSFPKTCTSMIKLNDEMEVLHRNMYIEPNKKYKISYVLSYPKKDTFGRLLINCQ